MIIQVNADDFGMTKGITDSILTCFDNGSLDSVSILPNGLAFKYALAEYKKRKQLKLNIHLNLAEGKSLSSPDKIYLLVDQNGFFKHSFISLFIKSVFSGRETKSLLQKQIALECKAQISNVINNLEEANGFLGLDSHLHYHMIPLIFNTIIELFKERQDYIRIPNEPFFIQIDSVDFLRNYIGANFIKHMLLKILSYINLKKMSHKTIRKNKYFAGVLFTGNMNLSVIDKILKRCPQDCFLEILFHPGIGKKNEEADLQNYLRYSNFHFLDSRKEEFNVINNTDFKELINTYRGAME